MSTIQIERPCVPAISSRSRGWMRRSCTGTVGRLSMKRRQDAPRSSEAYTPRSVPTKSRFSLRGSSRTTCTKSERAGRQPRRDGAEGIATVVGHLDTYGVKSLVRCPSKET